MPFSDMNWAQSSALNARVGVKWWKILSPSTYEEFVRLHEVIALEPSIPRFVIAITTELSSGHVPRAYQIANGTDHLVIEGVDPEAWPVGTPLIGIPIHVCPTVALHQEARIVRNHSITGESWDIAARNRRITI